MMKKRCRGVLAMALTVSILCACAEPEDGVQDAVIEQDEAIEQNTAMEQEDSTQNTTADIASPSVEVYTR